MGLSIQDAERLADEIYRDRRINGLIYCGRCGYCLRTLPYQYVCPECGQEYNARPTAMRGIYFPDQAALPAGDIFATLVYAAIAVALHWGAYAPLDGVRVGMAVVMSSFCVGSGYVAFRRLMSSLRARDITRRVRRQQSD